MIKWLIISVLCYAAAAWYVIRSRRHETGKHVKTIFGLICGVGSFALLVTKIGSAAIIVIAFLAPVLYMIGMDMSRRELMKYRHRQHKRKYNEDGTHIFK